MPAARVSLVLDSVRKGFEILQDVHANRTGQVRAGALGICVTSVLIVHPLFPAISRKADQNASASVILVLWPLMTTDRLTFANRIDRGPGPSRSDPIQDERNKKAAPAGNTGAADGSGSHQEVLEMRPVKRTAPRMVSGRYSPSRHIRSAQDPELVSGCFGTGSICNQCCL